MGEFGLYFDTACHSTVHVPQVATIITPEMVPVPFRVEIMSSYSTDDLSNASF